MSPRIENIEKKFLLGKSLNVSFSNNRTPELWKSFRPFIKTIPHRKNADLLSLEIFPDHFFVKFDPEVSFQKWAAVEVSQDSDIEEGLEKLIVPAGKYAVFIHKGPASEGARTYNYIFNEWMPASVYEVDQRPHFAVMGEKYKQDGPESEEEIWIPIKNKK